MTVLCFVDQYEYDSSMNTLHLFTFIEISHMKVKVLTCTLWWCEGQSIENLHNPQGLYWKYNSIKTYFFWLFVIIFDLITLFYIKTFLSIWVTIKTYLEFVRSGMAPFKSKVTKLLKIRLFNTMKTFNIL